MKLSDVIKDVSEDTGLSLRTVHGVIRKYQDVIRDCLKNGDRVSFEGIGCLEVAEQAARKCRNIWTGEAVDVPAKKRVRFRCSPGLKSELNK